jgi:phage virion morphogenesis protein
VTGAGIEVRGALAFALEGRDEAVRKLREAAGRAAQPQLMYDAIGAMLVTSTQDRFERETDPAGSPWPASIRVQLEGGKTLTDTAFLRNSITFEADEGGVAVGTNAAYAATHQFGATIRPVTAKALAFEIGGVSVFAREVTIPQRAFLGLDDADEEAMLGIAGDFLLEPITGARPEAAHAR